jgi:hypothetical protein
MSLDKQQFVRHVILPTLSHIDLYSKEAVVLLLGTAMIESRLEYLHQIKGPALGVYQMEPATHDDIRMNYLKYRPELAAKVRGLTVNMQAGDMITNLAYATAMCRVHYYRVKAPLPSLDALEMADYHKEYYNTVQGKTRVSESTRVFQRLIGLCYDT